MLSVIRLLDCIGLEDFSLCMLAFAGPPRGVREHSPREVLGRAPPRVHGPPQAALPRDPRQGGQEAVRQKGQVWRPRQVVQILAPTDPRPIRCPYAESFQCLML